MPGNSAKISNWAAMIAITGSWILIAGSIAGAFYSNKGPAIYGFVVGAIVLAIYWPLKFLTPVSKFLISNNIANIVYMIALSIYCFLSAPTIMGGISYITSAIVFGIAIYMGEKHNTVAGTRV